MTTTGRVGSLSLLTDIQRDVTLTQGRLSDLQNQISSGYKSRTFAGLDGSVEQYTLINSQINRTNQFIRNNELNISRLQTADIALSNIVDITDRIKNAIVGTNGANIGTSNLRQIVNDLLVSFGAELNASFNGFYVFGGTDTTNPPVPDTTVASGTSGVPDDAYYAGSKQDSILRFDERTDITFPVRADDTAFQKIYAAAHLAMSAANTKDTQALSNAQQLIQAGQAELVSVRSRNAGTVLNAQTIDERQKSLVTHWQDLSDAFAKTDIVKASTEVASNQAILQASYQVYARLSQLRLSDYL
jgi:flagellar hook-associated protein 3 FlgL